MTTKQRQAKLKMIIAAEKMLKDAKKSLRFEHSAQNFNGYMICAKSKINEALNSL